MGLRGLVPEFFKSDRGAVVSEDPFPWKSLCHHSIKCQTWNLCSVSCCTNHPLWFCNSYPNSQDPAITHKCHNWTQVTNMCKLSMTLWLALGYQSSWSFSSPPLLTLTTTGSRENCRVWFMTKWFCYIDYVCSMYLLSKCCCWIYIRGQSIGIDQGGCFIGWVSQHLHLLFSAILNS